MKVLRGRHSFPHRRISWRDRKARTTHTCESLEPRPSSHSATIHKGDPYIVVGIRPEKTDPTQRWVHVKLCAACAASFGLVELEGAEELAS